MDKNKSGNPPFLAKDLFDQQTPLPDAPKPEHLPTKLTYASVVDVVGAETEITDLMVRRACAEAERFEQFPFGPRKSYSG